jgi:hypothetical protein
MPIRGEPHLTGPWNNGVIYALTSEEVPLFALYAMQNVEVGFAGELRKRLGSDLVNTSALNSAATMTAIGKHEFNATSAAYFAIVGDKFYEDIESTPVDRTGGLTITAGDDNTWHFADASGTLIGHNGVNGDSLVKWPAEGGNISALDVDSRFTWANWWAFWDGRPWAANSSGGVARCNYGSNVDIETWGVNDYFTQTTDITGIAPLGDEAMVLHGKNQIALLSPTQITDTPYQRYGRGTKGTISGRALICVPGPGGECWQLFPRREGIFKYDGRGEATKISYQLDGIRYWDNINADRLHKSFAIHYAKKNCVWFYLPYGDGQINMNHIMIYDYSKEMWYGPYVNGVILERFCGALINDLPHFGGDDGFMYIHEKNENDDDGTTENKIDGWAQISGKAPLGNDVKVRWLHAVIDTQILANSNIAVTQFSQDTATNYFSFAQHGGFDTIGVSFQVGVSKITGGMLTESVDMKLYGYGPQSQLEIRNQEANQPFAIRTITQVYKTIGRQRKHSAGIS